jgi:hypothetical protein
MYPEFRKENSNFRLFATANGNGKLTYVCCKGKRKTVLPGGRNSGQKAQKGPEKKNLAGRIYGRIMAEFRQKWQKSG